MAASDMFSYFSCLRRRLHAIAATHSASSPVSISSVAVLEDIFLPNISHIKNNRAKEHPTISKMISVISLITILFVFSIMIAYLFELVNRM